MKNIKNIILGIVKYIPDITRDEMINVGLVMHSPEDKLLKAKFTKNYKRVKEFDDEIEIEIFKEFISQMENEFNMDLFSINDDISYTDPDLIKKLSYNYINQFNFHIKRISYEISNLHQEFEGLCKFYLNYDYDKKLRLKKEEKIQYVHRFFKMNKIEYETIKLNSFKGVYKENLNPDFKVNNNLIKMFKFEDSNYKGLLDTVKAWALNSIELKEMGYKVIFTIDDYAQNDQTKRYRNILETHGPVYDGISDDNLIRSLKSDYIS